MADELKIDIAPIDEIEVGTSKTTIVTFTNMTESRIKNIEPKSETPESELSGEIPAELYPGASFTMNLKLSPNAWTPDGITARVSAKAKQVSR